MVVCMLKGPEPKTSDASNVCGPVPGGVETAAVDGGELLTGEVDAGTVVAATSGWTVVGAGALDGDELHANDPSDEKTTNERTIQLARDGV
ncbi:MAG: hypothetical protein ACXV6M_05810, partial [Ilumatobacteraceae bacterium]